MKGTRLVGIDHFVENHFVESIDRSNQVVVNKVKLPKAF